MRFLYSFLPAWVESKRRASLQGEPKNRARKEFSEAVIQLGQRTSEVTSTARDAIDIMNRQRGRET